MSSPGGLFRVLAVALCVGLSPGRPVHADSLVDDALAAPTPRPVDGYRNGRRTTIHVVSVDWTEVEVRTARALAAMRAAAELDGVGIRVRSGFRSQEHQVWLYAAWREGWGNRAARPGYSNHQSGAALDLDIGDPMTFAWLEQHAARFGFRRTVKTEPWHWEYAKRYIKKQPAKRAKPARRSR